MQENIDQEIRNKIKYLMKKMGIKKTQIGRLMGNFQEEISQESYQRANRFLNGNNAVKISVLIKIAQFFDKPLEYFIPLELLPTELASPEKPKDPKQKNFSKIAENLKKLGFSESFIQNEIKELKRANSCKK